MRFPPCVLCCNRCLGRVLTGAASEGERRFELLAARSAAEARQQERTRIDVVLLGRFDDREQRGGGVRSLVGC